MVKKPEFSGVNNIFSSIRQSIVRIWIAPELPSNDRLEVYPLRMNIPVLAERKYLKTTRTLAIWGYFSLMLSVLIVMLIYIMVPQRVAVPRFLVFNNELMRMEIAEQSHVTRAALDLEAERLVTEYVVARMSFFASSADRTRHIVENRNLLDLFFVGGGRGENVSFVPYHQRLIAEQSGPRGNFNRRVMVTSATRLNETTWLVDFVTEDNFLNNEFHSRFIRWRAYVFGSFLTAAEQREREWSNLSAVNPLAFSISKFLLARRD
ncbi:MAG: hypothetical protein FWF01_04245 [Alphaproteobacteria bacterium]|nr:hypothetical protein [Alphaproteobacteria bacterium]